GNWSDKVGRKWIMLLGMFLAVITYRPLFGKLFSIADETNKTEALDKKQINTAIKPIVNTGNSLRTVGTMHFFDDGTQVTETRTDTVYAEAGRTTIKPDTKISKLLPT